jgi:hypothetical protein
MYIICCCLFLMDSKCIILIFSILSCLAFGTFSSQRVCIETGLSFTQLLITISFLQELMVHCS